MKKTELTQLIREEIRKVLKESQSESMYDYDLLMSKIDKKVSAYDDSKFNMLVNKAKSIFGIDDNSKPENKDQFIADAILNGKSGDYLHYNSNGRPWQGEEYSLKDVVRVAKTLNLI